MRKDFEERRRRAEGCGKWFRLVEYEQYTLSLYKEEIARLFLIQEFRSLFAGVNGSQEARKNLANLLGATER